MRRTNLNEMTPRWLMVFAVLAMLASVMMGFAKHTMAADDAYLRMRLGNPGAGCQTQTPCDPAGFTDICCDWGAGNVLATASTEMTPSNPKKDRSPPSFPINSNDLSRILICADCSNFKLAKAYSPGAGTETYLATARLRI